MSLVARAAWYIETHFSQNLTLELVARACSVSRFHLLRAFTLGTGMPLMSYVRARRLTEAARALAGGAPDILAVAFASGYDSHPGFTRAFRDQFGITPEALRARGSLQNLPTVEPFQMNAQPLTNPPAPRIAQGARLLLNGIAETCDEQTSARIPMMWQRFVPHLGSIPGQSGSTAYGVLYNAAEDGKTDYLCAVEVRSFANTPPGWTCLTIPASTYALFIHSEHVSTIRQTWKAVWSQWPEQLEPSGGPEFERYGESFNGQTGLGGVEIWIPIKS